MKTLAIICGLSLAFGAIRCNAPHSSSPAAQNADTANAHSSDSSPNRENANVFMRQTPFDTLVKRFENPERMEWQKPDKVIQMLQPLSGKTIADIGAGTGYFSARLASRAAKVIAIDIDPQFIDYLNKEVAKNNYKNIEVRQTSPQTPGLKEQEADKVLIVNTYHHIENRNAWLRALKKGMKKESVLCIVDFKKGKIPHGPPDSHKLAPEAVIAELEKAGFQPTQTDTQTLAYQYIIFAAPLR